jgi:hypothetical protein
LELLRGIEGQEYVYDSDLDEVWTAAQWENTTPDERALGVRLNRSMWRKAIFHYIKAEEERKDTADAASAAIDARNKRMRRRRVRMGGSESEPSN